MVDNIDVFVCNPNAGTNKNRSGIYVQFDVLDHRGASTGASHTVVMPTADAMVLLRLLEYLQQKFSLAKPPGDAITERPISAEQAAGEVQE